MKSLVFAIVTGVAVVSCLSGCRHVQVYERSKLAHPTMTAATFAGPAEEHMYSVQEGATGGSGPESGCGCN